MTRDPGMRGEEARAAASLAELALRVERFLAAVYGAYAFFAFGMSVIAAILISVGLAEAGLVGYWIVSPSILAGLVLASLLFYTVTGPVYRRLITAGRYRSGERLSSLAGVAVFAAGMTVSYLAASLAWPEVVEVAWYPGLALSLLFYAVLCEPGSDCRLGFLTAVVVMAAGMPLVLYL